MKYFIYHFTLRSGLKKTGSSRLFFKISFEVFVFRVFDIASQSIHTTWRNSKRKFIQFGITYRNLSLVLSEKYIRERTLPKYCNHEEVRAIQSCYADRVSQMVSALVRVSLCSRRILQNLNSEWLYRLCNPRRSCHKASSFSKELGCLVGKGELNKIRIIDRVDNYSLASVSDLEACYLAAALCIYLK